jgi:UDP-glucose 4-epimerase
MANNPSRVLITGITGRVGSHLAAELLEQDVAVRGLVMPGDRLRSEVDPAVEVVEGDLEDSAALDAAVANVSHIAHLAAVILYQPHQDDLIWQVNVEGTRNLMRAIQQRPPSPLRLLFASSDQVYPGPFPRYTPTDEEHPLEPTTTYGVSKLIGEELTRHTARVVPNCRFTIVRFCHNQTWQEILDPHGFFAERQFYVKGRLAWLVDSGRTDPATTESIRRLQAVDTDDNPLLLSLTDTGDPLALDMMDTRDIAAGLVPALFRPEARDNVYNFAPETTVSFTEVVPYMGKVLDKRWVEVKLPGTPARSNLSGAKAMRDLEVGARYSVFDMIDEASQAGIGR